MAERLGIATHVLFDSENLFWGFGAWRIKDAAKRARARLRHLVLFPAVPDSVARHLTTLLVDETVDWLEQELDPVERHSYAKSSDPGVASAMEALRRRGFVHHEVPVGPDAADDALNANLTEIVLAEDGGHLTVGSGDDRVIRRATTWVERRPEWGCIVIVPDSVTHRPDAIAAAAPAHVAVTSLDRIRQARRDIRAIDRSARETHRRRVAAAEQALRRTRSSRLYELGATVVAIARREFLPSPTPSTAWAHAMVDRLTSYGCERDNAERLTAWLAEQPADDSAPRSQDAIRESLFTAAVLVTYAAEPTPQLLTMLYEAVDKADPRALTALARALATWMPAPM